MVPIRRNAPIGAIGNYWARVRVPEAHEVSLLQALADTTSVAMENVRLEKPPSFAELRNIVRTLSGLSIVDEPHGEPALVLADGPAA